MTPEKTSVEKITQWVFDKFEVLKTHKQELSELLNNMDNFSNILRMMKDGEIISQVDYNKIITMIRFKGIKLQCSIWEDKSVEEHIQESKLLLEFIDKYPLVADGNEIISPWRYKELQEDNIFVTKAWNKIWLVKKIDNGDGDATLKSIFTPLYYNTLYYDRYKEYWLIGLGDENIALPKLKFYQLQKDWEIKDIYSIDLCDKFSGFDKDNIGIGRLNNGEYMLIYLRKWSDWNSYIHQLWQKFKLKYMEWFTCFDEHNSLEIDVDIRWKTTLRKAYDREWKFLGIHAFKKSLFGKEEKKSDFK